MSKTGRKLDRDTSSNSVRTDPDLIEILESLPPNERSDEGSIIRFYQIPERKRSYFTIWFQDGCETIEIDEITFMEDHYELKIAEIKLQHESELEAMKTHIRSSLEKVKKLATESSQVEIAKILETL